MRRARGHLLALLATGGALALVLDAPPDGRTANDDASHRIVIDASRVAEAERGVVAETGHAPDATERATLLAAEIDDEILYREARRLGLDDGDAVVQRRIAGNLAFVEDGPPPGLDAVAAAGGMAASARPIAADMLQQDVVVRRRLIERMRAHLEQDALAEEPDDAELAAALASNAARFALPPRVRLALAPAPVAGGGGGRPGEAGGEVDPALVRELPPQSERDLARVYGAPFARAALQASPGRWSAPIPANAGRYRVLVRAQEPSRLPPLDAVRNQVRELVRREHAAAAVRRQLDELRSAYTVSLAPVLADRRG